MIKARARAQGTSCRRALRVETGVTGEVPTMESDSFQKHEGFSNSMLIVLLPLSAASSRPLESTNLLLGQLGSLSIPTLVADLFSLLWETVGTQWQIPHNVPEAAALLPLTSSRCDPANSSLGQLLSGPRRRSAHPPA